MKDQAGILAPGKKFLAQDLPGEFQENMVKIRPVSERGSATIHKQVLFR
jgi:hypothetical protein